MRKSRRKVSKNLIEKFTKEEEEEDVDDTGCFERFDPNSENKRMQNFRSNVEYFQNLRPNGHNDNDVEDDNSDSGCESDINTKMDICSEKESINAECIINDGDIEIINVPEDINELQCNFNDEKPTSTHKNCFGCKITSDPESHKIMLNNDAMGKLCEIMNEGMFNGNVDGASVDAEKYFNKYIGP